MTTKPYLYLNDWIGDHQRIIDIAREAERRGFPGVYSESPGDNVALSLAVLDRTERITVGTGILGIYLQHAHTTATAAMLIEDLHPGRFQLGLGVSHVPFHEDMGVRFGKPLGDMRRYVENIRMVAGSHRLPPLLIGALRRKMTSLAGEVGDGVMWANAALSHMPYSISQLPEDRSEGFILSSSAPACVSEDRGVALAGIRRYLLFYMKLPNYQNYFVEAGYEREVEQARQAAVRDDDEGVMAAISEAMAADIGVFGTPTEMQDQIAAWNAAGVEHLILDPVAATGAPSLAAFEIMAAFG
jgi:alkanesulfonate monooxygenase SsuD/methylene tetrahydromethanopterin reductase-like flavin-dependent oxidoreductase (luciferase family)